MQLSPSQIQTRILTLPNRPPFMLTRSLADIYETDPRYITQAVRRNPARFPDDFCFELTPQEIGRLQNEAIISNQVLNGKSLAFTRLGANQLSTVLKSTVAAARSVQIVRAFSAMEDAGHRPASPIAPPPETITLTKDDYIELLKQQNDGLAAKLKLAQIEKTTQPKRRNLTPAEQAEALRRSRAGETAGQIARAMGRSESGIRVYLKRLEVAHG